MVRLIAVLAVLAGLCSCADNSAAQTVNFNDSSVLRPTTKRVGLNIGDLNYYDTGQILKNLVGSLNPGFEPLISRQIWALDTSGTTTTFPVPDVYYAGPANYWVGGTFTVMASQVGGAELGCTGTIVQSGGANYPNEPVITVASACAAPFAVGDVIVLSNTAAPTPESWWENNNGGVWNSSLNGGKLTSDVTDLCPTCGTQALTMDATASGSTAAATWYFDTAYTQNLFVLMNGTFQISFWAKTAAQTPLITITAQRFADNDFNCGTTTQTPTTTWTQYTFTCTAAEQPSSATPASAYLKLSVAGGSIYLDNISFQKVNGNNSNTTVLRDEVFSTLQKFYANASGGNPGPFRYWLLQNAETMQNWTQPAYAHAPTVAGDKYFVGPAGTGQTQLSLEDYLILCQAIGAEPYLEVPVTFSAADASALVDFLAGSASTTYGARRIALGQAAPWTSVFSTIHLSFCNECWNTLFGGQNLPFRANAPGTLYDYSSIAKLIFAAMRANPAYVTSKFDLVMNAQTGVSYQMDASIQRVSPDSIELEDYMYSTVNDYSTDFALWTSAMVEPWDTIVDPSDPSNFYQSVHDYAGLSVCGPNGSSPCKVNLYEWGPGTFAGRIDQQHMDYATAGGGAGVVAALLPLLNMQYDNIVNQSYFALTGFQITGSNNLNAKVWGNTVDMGGATGNVRPQFQAVSLINQSIIGPMYSCPVANNPGFDFAGDTQNGTSVPPGSLPLTNVPLTYVFCFENGVNRSIVLINTDLTNPHSLSFAGTDPPSGSVNVRQFAPPSLDSLNEAASGQSTHSTYASITNTAYTLSSPTSLALPPHSVTALDFSVALQGPSFSLPAGTYPPTQSVSLTDAVAGTTLYYTTDGSVPTTSSTVYQAGAPISVSATETISAIAVNATLTSSVSTATYSIFPQPVTPVLSLATGSYAYGTTLTLNDATSGAVIYYTTDGSTPTSASTVYNGAITLNFTPSATPISFKAVAIANTISSPVASARYTILQIPPNLQFILLNYLAYGSGYSMQVDSVAGATPTGTVTVSINNKVFGSSDQWFQGKIGFYEPSATPADGWVLGSNTVTATFANDPIYQSTTFTQPVTFSLVSTTTALAASSTTAAVGSSVILTATVSDTSATGLVTFKDGAATLGTGTLSAGVATYKIAAVTAGTHSYTAAYGGSVSDATSTSTAVTVSALATTTTTLAASITSPVAGTNVNLTATVSSTAGTGTVTFLDGTTALGSATVMNGVATTTITAIVSGAHSYTAVYSGDTTYATSTSSPVAINASIATPNLLFILSTNNVIYNSGVSVNLESLSGPTPSGPVTFKINNQILQTVTGWFSGKNGYYEGSALPSDGWVVGNNTITASFAGDPIYAAQTYTQSATFSLLTTATTLSASNTAPPSGSSVTLTATVAPTAGTGTVKFMDGTASLGTSSLANGIATFSLSSIGVGNHSYTAVYNGDATHATSTSSAVIVSALAVSATSLAASSTSPMAGSNVTLTATTSPSTATGTVKFYEGTTLLGSSILSGGVAGYTVVAITANTHNYTAVYGGDANDATSTSSAVAVTPLAPSSITISASNTAPVAGSSVVLTGTLAPTAATGTVTFLDGATMLGVGAVSGGIATYTVGAVTVGSHVYSAAFTPANSYSASVSPALAVSASGISIINTSFTEYAAGHALHATTPAQDIPGSTWKDINSDWTYNSGGGIVSSNSDITIPTLLDANQADYAATFTFPAPNATLLFRYLDTNNYVSVKNLASGAITLYATTLAGGTTQLATIYTSTPAAPLSVTLSGSAAFMSSGGQTVYATLPATLTGGTQLGFFSTAPSFVINSVNVAVTRVLTTTTLAASNTAPTAGASITLTATSAPTAATGTVTFLDGTAVLGTGSISAGVATYTLASVAAGTHNYTATYPGNGTYASSTSAAVSVNTAAPPSTLISTTFNEYPSGHALGGTAPATDLAGSSWIDPNAEWSFITGGGIAAHGSDFSYPTLINAGTANYTATFTYPAAGATLLLRYVDLNNNLFVKTLSYGAVALYSQVAGSTTQLAILWISAPAAPLTVTLNGTTATIACNGSNATAVIPSNLLNATQLGFYAPSAGFILSSLNVTGAGQAVTTPTTTTLTASNIAPAASASITLTATAAPTAATGTVTFLDGTTSMGTGSISAGVATYTVASVAAGTHNYTATYPGNTTYASSTSAPVSVSTTAAATTPTTTNLAASNTAPAAGAGITLTATSAPTAAAGTVTFLDGTTTLGTGSISAGVATYTVASVAAGTHSYTAVYSGNATYASSTSATVNVTTTAAATTPTTTNLAASNTAPAAGAGITLTATSAPTAAAGTVTFLDGTTTLGTGSISAGVATYTVASVAAGTHSYTAVYSGNATYASSTSATVNVTTTAAATTPTTTNLAASNTAPAAGAGITLTATETPTAVTGAVTFLDGTSILGTGAISAGVATYTVASVAAGTHSYTATYPGNATYASSISGAVTVTTATNPSAALISTTFTEFAAGHALTGTAPATGGAGSTWSDPNSEWSFITGGGIAAHGSDFSYPTLINAGTANYTATFTYPAAGATLLLRYVDLNNNLFVKTLSYGAVALYSQVAGSTTQLAILWISSPAAPLTVSLNGSTATITCNGSNASAVIPAALLNATQLGFYAPSAGFILSSLNVTGAGQAATTPTITTLAASNTAPTAGASITLTATAAPTSATGTVTFLDGTTTLGTGSISAGMATYTIASIAAGTHSYTATYPGNATYASSTSAMVSVTTTAAATTPTSITLTASNTAPAAGASITLTATSAPPAATGTVTFLDGTTTLGTGAISAGVATYTVASIAAGTHSYTATYPGNATYASSTSGAVSVSTATDPSAALISTSFTEYASGHALAGTTPATNGAGSSWSDPNNEWSFVAGGGTVAHGSDFSYPTLINAGTANYTATFTYPAAGATLLLRYVDLNNNLFVKTLSYGAVALYSQVAGSTTQLAILWITSPAAPLTVTLNGTTAAIACNGSNASAVIPAALLNATQLGFYAPSAGFILSSLNVTHN